MSLLLGNAPSSPLDMSKFDRIAAKQYEWQVAEDGAIWGLVAGDQGYDDTGINLTDLVFHALAEADRHGWEAYRRGDRSWTKDRKIQAALAALISACREILEPAQGIEARQGGDALAAPSQDESPTPQSGGAP